MKKFPRLLVSAHCVLLLLALPSPALADIAPPEQIPGSNPVTDTQTTQVCMLEELVSIIVGPEIVSPEGLPALQAEVLAEFWMLNTGPEDETLQVRFPLNDANSNLSNVNLSPEMQEFSATVDGQMAEITRKEYAYPSGGSGTWAEFRVAFPSGQTVKIDARYRVYSTGYDPYASFSYILETGSGWQGSIGKGSIVLVLPYEPNPQNLVFAESTANPAPKIFGNQVVWNFTDLEPSNADNWHATIIFPSSWQVIGDLRQQVSTDPQNGEAWLGLGKAYLRTVLVKGGRDVYAPLADLLYLAEDALERAVALLPESFEARAQLLHAYSAHQFNLYQGLKTLDPALLNSAYTAFLRLMPITPEAEELLSFYIFMGYADEAPDPSALVAKPLDPESMTQTPVPTFEAFRVAGAAENFLPQPGTPQPLPQPSPTPQPSPSPQASPSATIHPEQTPAATGTAISQPSQTALPAASAPQQTTRVSGGLLLIGAVALILGALSFFWISSRRK